MSSNFYFLFTFIILGSLTFAIKAEAAVVPTLNLNVVGNSAQITLTGDKNFDIELHYGPGASRVITLGKTDMSGNFNTPVSLDSYNIDCGNTAYVVINGQVSPTIPWVNPAATCSNNITYYAPIGSTNQPPLLTAFSVSSDNAGGQFMTTGTTLTLTFNTNQAISNPVLWVGNRQITLTGNNSGPYSGTYKLIGGEPSPLPVIMRFTNLNGYTNEAAVSLGKLSVVTPSVATPPASTSNAPVSTSNSKHVFTTLLKIDDTGSEVTELQKKLTALGFYSGPITGKFGGLTLAAVKALQKASGLDQAGHVGPGTRAVLNK